MPTYKVTFKMNTAISFIDTPTFDGILSYAYAKDNLPGASFSQKLSIPKEDMLNFEGMPIVMHQNGYFKCSSMNFDKGNIIEDTQRWRKRWANKNDNIADFGKQKRKVRINAGEFKSYDMPLRTIDIPEVYFYFESNNVSEVERLLSKHIYFLGKKRSQGYGEIGRTEIEKSDFKFTGIYRPIPLRFFGKGEIEDLEKFTIQYCSWKPPYWNPDNFEQCIIPDRV